MRILLLIFLTLSLSACLGVPPGISPIQHINIHKYQGKWYEIARLDHSFESGLDNITAEYKLRDDGGLDVINRGYSKEDKEWEQAEGKAYFVAIQNDGYFKVSFFEPFYASYVIFELDKKDYQYAFITSNDKDYLWLLARTPNVDKKLIDYFIQRSKKLGFDTDKLIFVDHSPPL